MARLASVAFTHYDSDPRVRRMAEALAERGDDVTAIALKTAGFPRKRQVAGVNVVGVPIPRYRGRSNAAYAALYGGFFTAATAILSAMHRRRPFDVIHVNNMPDFIVFAGFPAKRRGAKVLLDLHDPMPELYASKFSRGENHPAVRLVTAVERASVSFADRVITVNEVMRDAFVRHGNPKDAFTVIENAADTRRFPVGAALGRQRSGSDVVRIVYHGTMTPRLGLDVALHAIKEVTDAGTAVSLALIGDGNDAPRLTGLVVELGLEEIVDLQIGYVPVEELLPHLIDADIGIVPAHAGAFTNTMVPSKLLEYVTLGIPSICSDLPAVRHYFDSDQVTFVKPGDAVALAEAIAALAHDPGRRRRQAERAMASLNRHNWATERQRYLDLIDELAEA